MEGQPIPQVTPRLYRREELPLLLQLTEHQIAKLIHTGQLRQIRICGEIRVDAREIEQLIATYKQIAERKEQQNAN